METHSDQFYVCDEVSLKKLLKENGRSGLALDIDETLSWTVGHWIELMMELFGNPEELTAKQMAGKYKLAQYVPYWKGRKDVEDWMHLQRTNDDLQLELPLIEGAKECVQELNALVPVVAYVTVRPQCVLPGTLKWLKQHGFPVAPVLGKPDSVTFEDGNSWKGHMLSRLLPEIVGIVDDNPKVAHAVAKDYPGKVFLFGHNDLDMEQFSKCVVSCPTWHDVTKNVKAVLVDGTGC